MSLFVISDLHLSLGTDKSMTVFAGWDDYVSRIDKNWRAVVDDDDTVVIPGDISWEMKQQNCLKDFSFIHSLPGKKILMKGNHDLWWESKAKFDRFITENGLYTLHFLHNNCYEYNEYVLCGSRGWYFDDEEGEKLIAREVGRIKMSLDEGKKTGKEPILFLHYPPITQSGVCDDIMDVIKDYGITRCYYGHIHSGGRFAAFQGEYDNITFKCVSCDMMNFTPYRLEK